MARITLLVVIYLAFVSVGLPDGIQGLAWPGMRASLHQPLEALGVVTAVLTAASSLSGFLSGRVLARFGTGPVTFVSALTTGLALWGLSVATGFPLVVALAFPLGFGAGSVDAGLNHFVAEHYSSRQMNWLHACWGVGATVGPMIMASALASDRGWRGGYGTVSLLQLTLAGLLLLSLGLWSRQGAAHAIPKSADGDGARKPPLYAPFLAATLFTVYAALEMGTGLWAASVLMEARGFEPERAGLAVTLFYGSIMGGRVLVGFVSERTGNRTLIRIGLFVALSGVALMLVRSRDLLPTAGLVLIGLGCAPIYPGLMHETPRRFDSEATRTVIGWQVASAYVGCALLPAAIGLLAARAGLEAVFPAIGACGLLLAFLTWQLDRVT